jgi:uncharacterized protein YegP (UPF0339 family)
MAGLEFQVYRDKAEEFRWRLVSDGADGGNNKTIADSGEGYENHDDCTNAINLIRTGAADATISDRTVT